MLKSEVQLLCNRLFEIQFSCFGFFAHLRAQRHYPLDKHYLVATRRTRTQFQEMLRIRQASSRFTRPVRSTQGTHTIERAGFFPAPRA